MIPTLTQIVLLVGGAAAAAAPFTAQTTDGDVVRGTLQQLGDGKIVLATDAGPRELDFGTLLRLAPEQTPRTSHEAAPATVILTDGTALPAASVELSEGSAAVTPADGEPLGIASRQVERIHFGAPPAAGDTQWQRMLAVEATGDLLVVRKGEVLDYLEGLVRSVGDETVQFEFDGDMLDVRRARVAGIIFYQSSRQALADPVCHVHDAAGATFAAASVELDDASLRLSTVGGIEIVRPLSEITALDFSQGKLLYLSDLEWDTSRTRWRPLIEPAEPPAVLATFYGPRRDRGFDESMLTLDGTPYAKGLALHSRSEVVYRLPPGYRRLVAVAGIADSARPAGNVRLVISGDGRELFAAEIRGSEAAVPLDVEISGVRQLTILVDFGADLDVGDRLYLCDARIVK